VNNSETIRIEDYLRGMFQLESIKVKIDEGFGDSAQLLIGDTLLGVITKDDEDEDVSYDLSMPVPSFDKQHLRTTFRVDTIETRGRPNKDDSVEVYLGDEFIGVIFKDEVDGRTTFMFNMAILDFDLPA